MRLPLVNVLVCILISLYSIGNAEWTGVKLRDVLKDAGLDVNDLPDEAKHAQFLGAEAYGCTPANHGFAAQLT